MSVEDLDLEVRYACDGIETQFSYSYKIFDDSHLDVYQIDDGVVTLLTLGDDYSVLVSDGDGGLIDFSAASVDGNAITGGVIDFDTAPLSGLELLILRKTPIIQDLVISSVSTFKMKQLENRLDYLTMIAQELGSKFKKVLSFGVETDLENKKLPSPVEDSFLRWNADDDLENVELSDVATSNDYNELDNLPNIPDLAPVQTVATRTGDVVLTKADVGLSQVDNVSDVDKPISDDTQDALDLKADQSSITNVNNTSDLSKPISNPTQSALDLKANLSLVSNVTNTSDTQKVASGPIKDALDALTLAGLADVDDSGFDSVAVVTYNPATLLFEAGASGGGGAVDSVNGEIGVVVLDKTDIGLTNVDNTSDADKPISTDTQTALDLKADQTSISNIDNTSDLDKPISTDTQTALDLKADQTSISNIDNTSDLDKPVSTATLSGLNALASSKANASAVSNVDNTSDANKPLSSASIAALALKANITQLPDRLSDLFGVYDQDLATGDYTTDASSQFLTFKNCTELKVGLASAFGGQAIFLGSSSVGESVPIVNSDDSPIGTWEADADSFGVLVCEESDTGVFTWRLVDLKSSGASGGGSKNYIDQDSAEVETGVGNWLSDDGAGSADADFVVTTTTTENIAGTRSLVIEKAAANTEDSFAKCLTTAIDLTDRGKTLYGSFSYDATATNYVSGDLIVQVYDVTNSAILYSGIEDGLEILKSKGRFNFTAQLEETTASIELRLVCASTNALAYDVVFDEFKFGPAAQVSTILRRSAVIDLAGNDNIIAGKIQVERIGSLVTIQVVENLTHSSSGAPGTNSGAIPEWAYPEALTANVYSHDAGTGVVRAISVSDSGGIELRYRNSAGSLAAQTSSGTAAGITYAVPALPSPTVTENELSLQTIKVIARRTTTQTVANNTNVDVDFNTLSKDTHGTFNISSDTFKAPKTALYSFSYSGAMGASATGYRQVALVVDGALDNESIKSTQPETTTARLSYYYEIDLIKDQEVKISVRQNSGSSKDLDNQRVVIKSIPDFTTLGVVNGGGIRDKTIYLNNPSQVTSNGVISFFTRSDLTIGKYYRVAIRMRYLTGSTNTPAMTLKNGATTIGLVNVDTNPSTTIVADAYGFFHFTATSVDLTIESSNTAAAHKLIGDTMVEITEVNSGSLVSSFT